MSDAAHIRRAILLAFGGEPRRGFPPAEPPVNRTRARFLASVALAVGASTVLAANAHAAAYRAPRNGFGQPDLTGTWSNETLTRMERQPQFGPRLVATPEEVAKLEGERAKFVEASKVTEAVRPQCASAASAFSPGCSYNSAFSDPTMRMMRVNGEARTSLVTFPATGRIPRKPIGKPRLDPFGPGIADNPENRGLADRCLVGQNISTGALLTPTLYNNTYVFQQSRDTVAVVVEMSHEARIIRLNAQHDNIPRWFGDSVGHWEGDTLVVDTIHFHPEQLDYNTDKLHLVERFTRAGPDRILYQFRVEDPGAYTEAWGGEYEFTTSKQPQYEYACHEGNYAMTGILAGAREDERRGVKRPIQSAATQGE